MATPGLSELHRLADEYHHGFVLTDSISRYRIRENAQAETRAAAPPDPSASYETYLDTNVQQPGEEGQFEPEDDGYTRSGVAAALNTSHNDAQPQVEGHATAYKLAARLANRSNGAPLATIIEQGSYSTLSSRVSLLSVGRFPSVKSTENTSPNRGSRRRSRSLDRKALQDIQEDLARESDTSAVAELYARPKEGHSGADPASGTATPLTSYRVKMQQSPICHSSDGVFDQDDRGVRGFIRGVLQNVRGVPRTRSRSSSLTQTPIVEHRASPLCRYENSPKFDRKGQGVEVVYLPGYNRNTSTRSFEGAAIPPAVNQARNRVNLDSDIELSARAHPPRVKSRSDTTEIGVALGSAPPVVPCRIATCSHERPLSTPVVYAGTRDVAREDGTAEAATCHNGMFDTSAPYNFDSIPIYRGHQSSERETSSARDVFTNQNASFCSTMSTSYSGTVLGVDLDLQHDFGIPVRRSQSPTPVWFTPQMAELERQAYSAESPQSLETVPNQVPFHSITSSALTSLLPIAAATGIVRPNFNTPTISFYSPSGNLIQPESSSSQCTSPSEDDDSSTITTSYYNRQNASPAGIRLIRPPLIPLTTHPSQKTPLPIHLRHHHNYRQPEMSQISSHESSVTSRGPVKGCDGFVREDSLSPRSGVFHPHGRDKVHRSTKLVLHDLKAEVKFYKTRFLAQAAAQSFAPSISKGKTLQERHVLNYETYAARPGANSTRNRGGKFGVDTVGSHAAHALRVCFCQPYDGAGKSTRTDTVRTCIGGGALPVNDRSKADQHAKDVERSLPNARIVGSRRHSEGKHTKKASNKITQQASHTGPGKSKKIKDC
ncbi:hypothetical protein OPT61_g5820 [Boeremia exigua]|uniref:Uncharacterized protein n=1 Tax=Boeremia exigua TaxID=749465 RepID=A0ACC2I8X3_9PLEO|nr:hypothetical protein OPT61_g5820 [Boeremia exigua]